MKTNQDELPELTPWFDSLRKIEVHRPQEQQKLGRQQFLEMAQTLTPTVSSSASTRLNGWMTSIQNFWKRKEVQPMLNILGTIMIVMALAFGGSGATVAAAQYSLPDQPLYGLKIASETLRQQLAQGNPVSEAELAVTFALRRVSEVQAMLQEGKNPSQGQMQRLQKQLDQALRLAANLPDAQAQPLLDQLRTRLQEQLKVQSQLRDGSGEGQQLQTQLREMLQTRLRLLEQNQGDLLQLRIQLQLQLQNQTQQMTPANPTHNTPGNTTPGSGGNPAPGTGSGSGTGGSGSGSGSGGTGSGSGTGGSGSGSGSSGSGSGSGSGCSGSGSGSGGSGSGSGSGGSGSGSGTGGSGSGSGTGGTGSGSGTGGSGSGSQKP